MAKLATDYHTDRLQVIETMRETLWPPPQMFQSVPGRAAVPNREVKAEATAGGGRNSSEIIRYRCFPDVKGIAIKTSTILYSAVASFHTSVTASKLAISALMMAGREWPFFNNTVAQLLPSPLSIAGELLTDPSLL